LQNVRTSSSQQTRIINSRVSHQVTQSVIIDAVPAKTGTYTVRSFNIDYKGEKLRIPSATLTVIDRPASAGPAVNEMVFVRTDLPDQLYVGQTIPVTLQLFVYEQIDLLDLNLIRPDADAYILTTPSDATQSSQRIDNRRYRVISWPLVLTPIRSDTVDTRFQFSLAARFPDGQRSWRNPFGETRRFTVSS